MARVRTAGPEDTAFVASLVPRFVEHGLAGGHTREEIVSGTIAVLIAALRNANPGELFLIAEDDDGTAAGFVFATTERDFFTGEPYLHVSEIATARSGGGIGGALMDAAEQYARDRGYRIVTLNVIEENVGARRFYERRAFVPGHRHLVKRLAP